MRPQSPLAKHLEHINISLPDAARMTGLSYHLLYGIRHGTAKYISPLVLGKLGELFSISAETFYKEYRAWRTDEASKTKYVNIDSAVHAQIKRISTQHGFDMRATVKHIVADYVERHQGEQHGNQHLSGRESIAVLDSRERRSSDTDAPTSDLLRAKLDAGAESGTASNSRSNNTGRCDGCRLESCQGECADGGDSCRDC